MEDSFDHIIEDVFRDDGITSAKCAGYLDRMKALYGCGPQYERKSIDLPTDYFGKTLNLGDTICEVDVWKDYGCSSDDPGYVIQSFELWEDGWVINARDEDSDACMPMRPADCVIRPKRTVRTVLAEFVIDYADDVQTGGDGSKYLDKYEEMFELKGKDA